MRGEKQIGFIVITWQLFIAPDKQYQDDTLLKEKRSKGDCVKKSMCLLKTMVASPTSIRYCTVFAEFSSLEDRTLEIYVTFKNKCLQNKLWAEVTESPRKVIL